MAYTKLPYWQYFIDVSNDYNKTGKARFEVKYNTIEYEYKGGKFKADYCVRYDEECDVIQALFQETLGLTDWVTNFMFVSKYYNSFDYKGKKITLKVHNGWAAMYKAMKHQIRDEVTRLLAEKGKDTPIESIGWSLGSGMAMLCAQDINYNLGLKPHLITFGSVNAFKTSLLDRKRTLEYLRDCCESVRCFSDVNDVVSYVVPTVLGFIKPDRTDTHLDKFSPFKLIDPKTYHTKYDEPRLYEDIKD